MYKNEAFEILGIAPTEDAREIKRAYSNLVRKFHPEEHPEEWQRIHDAYEIALDQGRNKVRPEERSQSPVPTDVYDYVQPSSDKVEEKIEEDEEWIDTESFFQERQKGQKEDGQIAKAEVYTFFHNSSRSQINSYAGWKKFLESPALASVCMEEGILKEFADLLKIFNPATPICRLLEKYFKEIRHRIDNTPYTESKQEKLLLVREIENKLDRIVERRRIRIETIVFCLIVVYMVGTGSGYAGNTKKDTTDNRKEPQKHIYLTAEEKLKGAKIGDPYVSSENIIGLYLIKGYDRIEGDNNSYHNVDSEKKYVPNQSKLPQSGELVGCIFVKSKDGTADDVVLCMPLQEFELVDGEFVLYQYDAATQAYMEKKISHPESIALLADFPYIYNDVLYMRMREYEKKGQYAALNDMNCIAIFRTDN